MLGLALGVTFLLIGETSMNVDGDLDIGAFDGFWLILGLPVITLLVFVILSPLSFLIHRLLSRKDAGNASQD